MQEKWLETLKFRTQAHAATPRKKDGHTETLQKKNEDNICAHTVSYLIHYLISETTSAESIGYKQM